MTSMTTSNTLSMAGIGKRYGDFVALDDIYLDIAQGEFLTLLGPSGSGKTTLLMTLAGFLQPDSGVIKHGAQDITRLPAEQRNFGMVFQGYALFPHMTVAQNVDFPLRLRKVPAAERKRRVSRMLEVVGLAEHHHKKPNQLSGGQQQRVAIARALVFEPQLLLLDEPLSALDKNLREQLQGELQRIHREVGTSFVFVTHDQGEALALSSRIAIFNRGRLVQVDTPQAIYQRPESRFVAEFIGKMNLLGFNGASRQGEHYVCAREAIRLYAQSDRVHTTQDLVLAVRPEHMRLSAEPLEQIAHNSLPVQITEQVYQGATSFLSLRTYAGESLQITVPSAEMSAYGIGQQLHVSWPVTAGIVLPA